MADVFVQAFKQGDKFSFYYSYGTGGDAATLIADVKSYVGGDALATLTVVEDAATDGLYFMSTDVDTSDWPAIVKVDIWHTDLEVHDETTLTFTFGEAVTDGRDRS